ncbi:PfaB family protein [Anthocerotibacter panamensis]|uniref:PfaB family protein n=1 Tax=Anthocerotibacter panamensis TaxID=2857077 RepID=UPI001C4024E2|nr:PfaB family protein [Anthocerotibacter panamensis]
MEKIAIIGTSCLFPDAKNPEEFWQNLLDQKDSKTLATAKEIGTDPAKFYDPVKGKVDKTYLLKGGYIHDFPFDAAEYDLPEVLLAGLDPIFKGALYVTKQALERTNYLGNKAVLSRCGLILSNLSLPTKYSNHLFRPVYHKVLNRTLRELFQKDDFQLGIQDAPDVVSPYNAMTGGFQVPLIAQAFSLSGISFALDAACSSSLYATKLACYYLTSHNVDLMLAGAISYADQLFIRMIFAGVQGFPENGISVPLDKSSRGLVPADGFGLIVLKRYQDAMRDGDHIYATIEGIGLSNDGRGKHYLSPNPQGQLLAYERAYREAGLDPKDIDYIECHATGTVLGDGTELNSIETFFRQYQASPLVGSVKANIGHLLTVAGLASTLKAVMGIEKGIIPATIHVQNPASSQNNLITAENIVRANTAWPENNTSRHAAISAFGFGGNNAHLIIKQTPTPLPSVEAQVYTPVPEAKLAILGMDAHFASCRGLEEFDRSIYEGNQALSPVPPHRWKGIEAEQTLLQEYGFEGGSVPLGGYIQDFEVDPIYLRIPPNEVDKLNPQQILMLKVADHALKDASIKEGTSVAVIIAMDIELSAHQLQARWNLPWELQESLLEHGIFLTAEQRLILENLIKESLHNPAKTSEFLSFIGNIMSSRISSLWNFTAPSFTLTAGENATFKALEVAQVLLSNGEAEAVLVGAVDLAGGFESVLLRHQLSPANRGIASLSYAQNAKGWVPGEGAGAVVLKLYETAKQAGDRIYAVIDSISLLQRNPTFDKSDSFPKAPSSAAVEEVCSVALKKSNLKPENISYLEVFASGFPDEDEAEIKGIIQAYRSATSDITCALGSVKANIGHTFVASGMASLIKTALCLYYRYIPAVPKWSAPKFPELWQNSPFYVATESRPWLIEHGLGRRIAAINSLSIDGTYAHLILEEHKQAAESIAPAYQRDHNFLEHTPFHLFSLAGDDRAALLEEIHRLGQTLEASPSLAAAASQTFAVFQQRAQANYALAILGHTKDEVLREIQRASQGVEQAFERGEDWKTPLGSFFTAKPLGQRGGLAFVYPGAFGSYVGLGRNFLRLFPEVFNDPMIAALDGQRATTINKILYPRSMQKFSNRQLEALDQQFISSVHTMFESEVGYARIITTLTRDHFKIQPQFAFGYSLGEISMISAQGVWSEFNQHMQAVLTSPLFSERLSGPMYAVRESWDLPLDQKDAEFWSTYVLIAPAAQVAEYLKQESRVYLTQINTPHEVVIAGDSRGCSRVIQALKCDSFRAPFNYAIHCAAMASEYPELTRINTRPIAHVPNTVFYSSAEYQPVAATTEALAHHLSQGLCQPLDFPRLVNRVYEDGARVFLEVGAGSICSRWLDKILDQQEHVTVSMNRRGVDDHTAIVRALSKLVSHRVALDLSVLYAPVRSNPDLSRLKTVTLGGPPLRTTILKEGKKILSNPTPQPERTVAPAPPRLPVQQGVAPPVPPVSPPSAPPVLLVAPPTEPVAGELPARPTSYSEQVPPISPLQYQKLHINATRATQAHGAFLQARQEALQHLVEMIRLQVTYSQQMLREIWPEDNPRS